MPIAFVLIGVESGSEHEVVEQLKRMSAVKGCYSVYGVYDVVVKIEAGSERELKEAITYKLRGLAKIRSTQTLMVSD
jgi:DNA-binding Lrp family transcriptional regulator